MTCVTLDTDLVHDLIQPILAVRDDNVCYLNVSKDNITLTARSEDRTVYVVNKIDMPANHRLFGMTTGQLYVDVGRLNDFLKIGGAEEITMDIPLDSSESKISLESGELTYRFPTLVEQNAYEVPNTATTNSNVGFSLVNDVLHRSVQVADLVDGELTVHAEPATDSVSLSATGIHDAFTFPAPNRDLSEVQGDSISLTIPINIVGKILPLIPTDNQVDVRISSESLTILAPSTPPCSHLNILVAERKSTI